MQLNVREISQMASGGSYVVIYDAEFDLSEAPLITVDVLSVDPPEVEAELVEMARLAILRGAAHVLEPTGRGASIRVHRLVINPVDFKPGHFARLTAEEIGRLLDQVSSR